MVMTRLGVIGVLLIVRNCWPKELLRKHVRDPAGVEQAGLVVKRLLKVLCREELMTILEPDGRAVLPRVSVTVEISPTKRDDGDKEHAMVLALMVVMPVLAKLTPDADAVTGKLLAKEGLTIVIDRS